MNIAQTSTVTVPWAEDSNRDVTVTVTVAVTDNLFKHEYRKAPALPPSCPDYYTDLFGAPLHEVLPKTQFISNIIPNITPRSRPRVIY